MFYRVAALVTVGKAKSVSSSYVVNFNDSRAVGIDNLAFCSFEDCFGKCFCIVCTVYGNVSCAVLGFAFYQSVTVIVGVLIIVLNGKGSIGIGVPNSIVGKVRRGHGGRKFCIPTCEGVTQYAKGRGGGQSCTVSYGMFYCVAALVTVGKGKGVGCSYIVNFDHGRAVGTHSLGLCAFKDCFCEGFYMACAVYFRIGRALLGFAFYQSVTVIVGVLIIVLNGKFGVGIGSPSSVVGEVGCGHKAYRIAIPTCEGVTDYGKFRRFGDACAVSYANNHSLAVQVAVSVGHGKGLTVIVNLNDSRAVCGDFLAFGVCQNNAVLSEGCQSCTVNDCTGYTCSAIGMIQGVFVVIRVLQVMFNLVRDAVTCGPCSVQDDVFGRHGSRNFSVPTVEYIPFYSEGRIIAYILTVAQSVGGIFTCFVTVGKGKSIGSSCVVNFDDSRAVCIYSLAFCAFKDRLGESFLIICAVDGGIGCTVLGFAFYQSITVVVGILIVMFNGKGGVFPGSPLRHIDKIRCGHGGSHFPIPTNKGITHYAKYGSGGQSCTVEDRLFYGCAYFITVSIGNFVAVSCVVYIDDSTAVSVYNHILVSITVGEAFKGLLIVRTVNNTTGLGSQSFGVRHNVCIIKIGNPMLDGHIHAFGFPFRGVGNIFRGNGLRYIGIPTHKDVAQNIEVGENNGTFVRKNEYHILACANNVTVGESQGVFISCVVNTYFC